MKRTLLATAILVLLLPGAYAGARDHTYQIKPGLTAVVTVSGQNRHTVSARVGKGPVQQLAVMDDEAVDVFETPDIDHDGYADLAIGQSGGGTQARMRLFLYRPNEGRYQEIRHPARGQPLPRLRQPGLRRRQARLLNGLPIQRRQPGRGKLRRAPRRHGRSRVLDHADLVPAGKREGRGPVRVPRRRHGGPNPAGRRRLAVRRRRQRGALDRVDLYDAPDITSGPSTQLRAGERYDVVALRPAGWLQVRLPGQKDAAALKWLRYVDLVIDRHGLAPSAQGDAPASDRQAR